VLDGTWKSGSVWGGVKEGMIRVGDFGTKVPKAVHERVTQSIVSRERARMADGREAWVLERRVPGRDGTVRQIRPDP